MPAVAVDLEMDNKRVRGKLVAVSLFLSHIGYFCLTNINSSVL